MMRSKRCTECGSSFLTADPSITICQNCSGDLPDTSKEDARQEATRQRQRQATTEKSQQVSLRDLDDERETNQQVDLKKLAGTTPTKRTRKTRAPKNES